jgi:hypothetical protein
MELEMTANYITLRFKNATPTGDGEFDLSDGVYSMSAFPAFVFSGASFSLNTLALNTTQFMLTPASDTMSGQIQISISAATKDPTLIMSGFKDDSVSVQWPLAKGGTNSQDMTQGHNVTLTGFFAPASPPPPPPPAR